MQVRDSYSMRVLSRLICDQWSNVRTNQRRRRSDNFAHSSSGQRLLVYRGSSSWQNADLADGRSWWCARLSVCCGSSYMIVVALHSLSAFNTIDRHENAWILQSVTCLLLHKTRTDDHSRCHGTRTEGVFVLIYGSFSIADTYDRYELRMDACACTTCYPASCKSFVPLSMQERANHYQTATSTTPRH